MSISISPGEEKIQNRTWSALVEKLKQQQVSTVEQIQLSQKTLEEIHTQYFPGWREKPVCEAFPKLSLIEVGFFAAFVGGEFYLRVRRYLANLQESGTPYARQKFLLSGRETSKMLIDNAMLCGTDVQQEYLRYLAANKSFDQKWEEQQIQKNKAIVQRFKRHVCRLVAIFTMLGEFPLRYEGKNKNQDIMWVQIDEGKCWNEIDPKVYLCYLKQARSHHTEDKNICAPVIQIEHGPTLFWRDRITGELLDGVKPLCAPEFGRVWNHKHRIFQTLNFITKTVISIIWDYYFDDKLMYGEHQEQDKDVHLAQG